MSTKWENVYVFISSTFNDMHAERDYLVKRVFPELRDWCEKRRLRLIDIDLRWGVTEADATHNKNVVQVCLDKIDQCRPFFLCFLGQRYGWIPVLDDVSEETLKKFPDLEKYIGEERSVTDLEILHSVLEPFKKYTDGDGLKQFNAAEHTFFYVRNPDYLKDIPEEPYYRKRIYTDSIEKDEASRKYLIKKQDELLSRVDRANRPVHHYSTEWYTSRSVPALALPVGCPSIIEENRHRWRKQWLENANVKVSNSDTTVAKNYIHDAKKFNDLATQGRLGNFQFDLDDNYLPKKLQEKSGNLSLNSLIIEELKQAIVERYPDHVETKYSDDLEKELDQQSQFVALAREGFIEREGDFDALDEYVKNSGNKLFALTADAGMGKSTLLAKWISSFQENPTTFNDTDKVKDRISIYYRFIGQSDQSNTIFAIVYSLLKELQYDGTIPKEVSTKGDDGSIVMVPNEIQVDPIKIKIQWMEYLDKIDESKSIIIVFDAINQLDSGLNDIEWISREIPDNVKIVISFKTDDKQGRELEYRLERDNRVQVHKVESFQTREHRIKLVKSYLDQYLKELDDTLIDSLVNAKGAKNPLFLKVVLSELRVFGDFDNLKRKIDSDFGSTPQSAFDAVLFRLESDPTDVLGESHKVVPLVFGALSHTRYGLKSEEITKLLLDELQLEEINITELNETVEFYLKQVKPFLARRDGRFDFFYEAFMLSAKSNYTLTEQENKNEKQKSEIEWHENLANYFSDLPLRYPQKTRFRDQQPNRRKVSELPYHLIISEQWVKVIDTLCDIMFVEAKCQSGLVHELQDDYLLALTYLPEAKTQNEKDALRQTKTVNYTNNLIKYANGKKHELDVIASVIPWTEEQTDEENKRIFNNPSSLDKIRAFSQFIQIKTLELLYNKKYPGLCIQLAYNNAMNGPVGLAASKVLKSFQKFSLLLLHESSRFNYIPYPVIKKKLSGHESEVLAVGISPNGQYVVSASYDESIRLWEVKTGKCLKTLFGKSSFECVSFSADCKYALAGYGDGSLEYWDLELGICVKNLAGHKDEIKCVALTPDGNYAVSGGGKKDKTFRLWDIVNGKCLYISTEHVSSVECIAISANANRAITGGKYDKSIKIWDLNQGNCVRSLIGHTSPISKLTITPDGKFAISASEEELKLRLWNLDSGICEQILEGHTSTVGCISITPDGKHSMSGEEWGSRDLIVWDLFSGKCVKRFTGQSTEFFCVAVTPDGSGAITGHNSDIYIWDIEKSKNIDPKVKANGIGSIAITADGKQVLLGGNENIQVWNFDKHECVNNFSIKTNEDDYVTETLNDNNTDVGNNEGELHIWNLKTGACVNKLSGYSGWVNNIAITPDSKRMLLDWEIFGLWDINTGECIRTFVSDIHYITCFSITNDGRYAVTGSDEGLLNLWNLETGECEKSLIACEDKIGCVAITPEGKHVISTEGMFGTILQHWNMITGECINSLEGHTDSISCVDITSDGKHCLSGSLDNSIRIWDLETGKCCNTLLGHDGAISCLAIYSDDRRVVSGGYDNILRIWDVKTGECLKTLSGHSELVNSVVVTPDDKQVISGSSDKSIRIWDISTGKCLRNYTYESEITSVAVTSDGLHVISASGINNAVYEQYGEYDYFRSEVRLIEINLDNTLMVAVCDNTLDIWDLREGKCIASRKQTYEISCFRFVPDINSGTFLVMAKNIYDSSENLLLWDLENNDSIEFQGYTGNISCMAISPDGKYVIVGRYRDDLTTDTHNALELWDFESRRCIYTYTGHIGKIISVSITPDGKRAISAGEDKTLRVWNLLNGRCLTIWDKINVYINQIIISPDGKQLLSVRSDNSLYLTDLETGNDLAVYEEDIKLVSNILPNGDFVATGYNEVFKFKLNDITVPIIGLQRIWRIVGVKYRGRHDENVTAICFWCGVRFTVTDNVVKKIQMIHEKYHIKPTDSPCIKLPKQVWQDPSLLAECPHCNNPLRYNPFIAEPINNQVQFELDF